ncbi:PRADC1-like protein [Physella acuta]|uniref:PRADC1-like protein n=1 Tax=Physella acuta TaxID=109671 RepID=UPI0027DCDA25|nr:PRADC1-like protein [Physella acuta]
MGLAVYEEMSLLRCTSTISATLIFPVIFTYYILATTVAVYVAADIEIATAPDEYIVFEESLYFEITWPASLMYTYKLKQARDFGTRFDKIYQKVEMVLADPEDACQDLYNDVPGSVVLILRGGCSFLTKTKVAERAGALAAIIADNDESNDSIMIDMVSDSTDRVVNIPSFFLVGKDGSMIRRQLYAIRSDHAIINIPVNLTGKSIVEAKRPPWTIW